MALALSTVSRIPLMRNRSLRTLSQLVALRWLEYSHLHRSPLPHAEIKDFYILPLIIDKTDSRKTVYRACSVHILSGHHTLLL